jgi:hypothetical protein
MEARVPFPFFPAGALLALVVLTTALTAFGLILRALDRAILAGSRSILNGLISGFRSWTGDPDGPAPSSPPVAASAPAGEIIEIDNHRFSVGGR